MCYLYYPLNLNYCLRFEEADYTRRTQALKELGALLTNLIGTIGMVGGQGVLRIA